MLGYRNDGEMGFGTIKNGDRLDHEYTAIHLQGDSGTHGYTENNFAAFAMLGRRFALWIRGLHKQRIYRIIAAKDPKGFA